MMLALPSMPAMMVLESRLTMAARARPAIFQICAASPDGPDPRMATRYGGARSGSPSPAHSRRDAGMPCPASASAGGSGTRFGWRKAICLRSPASKATRALSSSRPGAASTRRTSYSPGGSSRRAFFFKSLSVYVC